MVFGHGGKRCGQKASGAESVGGRNRGGESAGAENVGGRKRGGRKRVYEMSLDSKRR